MYSLKWKSHCLVVFEDTKGCKLSRPFRFHQDQTVAWDVGETFTLHVYYHFSFPFIKPHSSKVIKVVRRHDWIHKRHPMSRDRSMYGPSQGETLLQCNDISHWLGGITRLIPACIILLDELLATLHQQLGKNKWPNVPFFLCAVFNIWRCIQQLWWANSVIDLCMKLLKKGKE